MGEAGPEAILPLTRTRGGDLGVKAAAGNITINVLNNSAAQVTTETSQNPDGQQIIDIFVNQIGDNVRRGGAVPKSIEQVYGVRRQGRLV